MAEDAEGVELDVGELINRVRQDNSLTSPTGRAKRVGAVLRQHKFTTWDMLCFSVEFIASLAGMVEWLQLPAKHLIRMLYLMHYVTTKDSDKIWLDQTSPSEQESSSTPKESSQDATTSGPSLIS